MIDQFPDPLDHGRLQVVRRGRRLRRLATSVRGRTRRLIAHRHLDTAMPAALHQREAHLAFPAMRGNGAADHVDRFGQFVAPLR